MSDPPPPPSPRPDDEPAATAAGATPSPGPASAVPPLADPPPAPTGAPPSAPTGVPVGATPPRPHPGETRPSPSVAPTRPNNPGATTASAASTGPTTGAAAAAPGSGASPSGAAAKAATGANAPSGVARRPGRDAAAARDGVPPVDGARARNTALAGLALLLAVLDGAAIAVLFAHPRVPGEVADQVANANGTAGAAAAEAGRATAAVAKLAPRVDALAGAGSATNGGAGDERALAARVDALERAVAGRPVAPAPTTPAPASAPNPDPGPQIAALSDRLDKAVAALNAALGTLRDDTRTGEASLAATERADSAALRQRLTEDRDAIDGAIASLNTRMGAAITRTEQAAVVADRAERLARLEAAGVALRDGRPVGAIAGAPPALARFADTPPPTEAALAIAFPAAARATLRASQPDTHRAGFFRRLWIRAQGAVTVSDGDRVLVGDPAAGVIATARDRLDAGDLGGAVATLGALDGAAAAAIAPWRDRARSLLDARTALAGMETSG